MKKFAFYLPQFHEIEENNKWWGEGFTEWVKVKGAVPLYKEHKQPKKPLNDNYYNLLDKSTVQWQTDLANNYGINGFVYYHYYFKGKKLLEKPAENLLEWKDINQKFFFCWANHSWYRSWEGTKELLMKQEYGNVDDWKKHFEYLLDFFKDERYEKKDNKPLLMVFDIKFEEKNEMFNYWNELSKANGFDGIHFIETSFGVSSQDQYDNYYENVSDLTEAIFVREPSNALGIYKEKKRRKILNKIYRKILMLLQKSKKNPSIPVYDGDKLLDCIIKQNIVSKKQMYRGLFFEWDNTPRHMNRGYVITPITKNKFDEYMETVGDSEYLFINAWNEWAEGMVLEPTENDQYKYLEWLLEHSSNNEEKRNAR